MRTDYFNDGPPWKLIFENKLGFRFTLVVRDPKPPETYEFPIVRTTRDMAITDRQKFKMVGRIGNIAAYTEI